ncbi:MAG: tetratricopeptide repeat protein [Xanthomonadaceae bacterium]|nr:tetratricopeptide repeat protein [Xanthomonadaceae bacterium]
MKERTIDQVLCTSFRVRLEKCPRFRQIVPLLVAALLSACAIQSRPVILPEPSPEPPAVEPPLTEPPAAELPSATEPAPVAKPQPSVADEISDRLLFHVLRAELAGNQGDLQQSQEAYLEAARLSRDPRLAERAARLALYLHDLPAAREAAQRWLQLAPNAPAAHEMLALVLLRGGDADSALRHLRQALALAPAGAAAGFERLSQLLARETGASKALALAAVEALASEHPDEPQAYQTLAELALRFEQPETALAAAEQAQRLAPDWTAPALLSVQAHLRMGEGERAIPRLQELLDRQPSDYDLRLQYARALLELERLEGALRQFELLLQARPDQAQIRYVAALLALELGEHEKARENLLQLINSGQRSDDAYFYLGRLAQLEGDARGAMRWFRQVQGQHRPEALLRLAVILGEQGQLAAARGQLQELRSQYPEQAARSYLLEAGLLREHERLEEAAALYSEALSAHPEDPDLRYGRALTYVLLGQIEAAEEDLRLLLAAYPDEPMYLNALGYTLVDMTERYQEGFELIQRAYELDPDIPAIIDSMGWALYRLQRLDEAREMLLQAYALDQDSEIAAHLIEVLWRLGERDEAQRILTEALQRKPDSRVLHDVRERLQ